MLHFVVTFRVFVSCFLEIRLLLSLEFLVFVIIFLCDA